MSRTRSRKYITAATTFSAALGIGFVMQYGDALASRLGAEAPVAGPDTRDLNEAQITPVSASVAVPQALVIPATRNKRIEVTPISSVPTEVETPSLAVTAVTTEPEIEVPAAPEPAIVTVAATSPDMTIVPEAEDQNDTTATPACETVLTATPGASAMVTLSLDAPCQPDTAVAFHHQGMMFHMITDDQGQVQVDVPALATEAFFIAAFDGGEGAVAMTGVPELALYDRAVLQWQGENHVQLHALEFGASYGEAGHVWAAAAGDSFDTMTGKGGFLTTLGDANAPNALMAEVYTFPSGMTSRDGRIQLNVESEITARNCGREVIAQSIQIGPNMDSTVIDLSMTMPTCDAAGEFLVLSNMFEDLTLAQK